MQKQKKEKKKEDVLNVYFETSIQEILAEQSLSSTNSSHILGKYRFVNEIAQRSSKMFDLDKESDWMQTRNPHPVSFN